MSDETVAVAAPWPELLPWQQDAARAALSARATWPHALLLAGPRGMGKRTLALNLARGLLCEAPRADGLACGTCPSCGFVAAGQHPDFQLLELFETDDGETKAVTEIKVDRIRALIDWAQLTGHRGRAKVAVIAPAEAMNPNAANALLKTLEEPPPATFLILVAHQAGRVPATLRSRCRRFPAPQPDSALATRWLQDAGIANPEVALAQAGGAPLLARALADPAWQQERALWLSALAKPKSLSPVALASRLETGAREDRRERLALALDWLGAWTFDLARVAAGAAPARNPDYAQSLATLASVVAPVRLFRYHRLLLQQRALVAHPLQPRLVAETMLIGYRDLFR